MTKLEELDYLITNLEKQKLVLDRYRCITIEEIRKLNNKRNLLKDFIDLVHQPLCSLPLTKG